MTDFFQGAIGIAGPVSAIYPIESPGGYQLFGRTLPAWQTWGKGKDFEPTRPWLLEAFDQVFLLGVHAAICLTLAKITFVPVGEDEYVEVGAFFSYIVAVIYLNSARTAIRCWPIRVPGKLGESSLCASDTNSSLDDNSHVLCPGAQRFPPISGRRGRGLQKATSRSKPH